MEVIAIGLYFWSKVVRHNFYRGNFFRANNFLENAALSVMRVDDITQNHREKLTAKRRISTKWLFFCILVSYEAHKV